MDLTLSRVDVLQVGATSKRCLKVLPSALAAKKAQKIVVGDATGTVQCFSLKKGEIVPMFKTLPGPKAISRIDLGSSVDEKQMQKIFVAAGQTIRGYTKKGKEFFRFDANLSEDIRNMVVETPAIWTSGEYTFHEFYDCKEKNFYLCKDRINDFIVPHLLSDREFNPVLGCQDRMIRILSGSELVFEVAVEGPVSSLIYYDPKASKSSSTPVPSSSSSSSQPPIAPLGKKPAASSSGDRQIIYGTSNGFVGQVLVDSMGARKGWVIAPTVSGQRVDAASAFGASDISSLSAIGSNGKKSGGVTCLTTVDFTSDGVKDILVGRDDGSIEVFGFDLSPTDPRLIFQRQVGESITGIEHGLVTSTECEDLLVTTYSGKLISFTMDSESLVANNMADGSLPSAGSSDSPAISSSSSSSSSALASLREKLTGPSSSASAASSEGASRLSKGGEKKVRVLREELDKLREKLDKEKEKFSKVSEEMIAVHTEYRLNDRFVLDPEDACHVLTVEMDVPIDTIILHSEVPLDVLDTDSSLAILSRTSAASSSSPSSSSVPSYQSGDYSQASSSSSSSSPQSPSSKLIASFRCTDTTNRLDVRIRTVEGQSGDLQVFIVPRLSPKTAESRTYSVKPLSLHQRVHSIDESRPVNELRMAGGFSLAEMHSWITLCIPDVPEKLYSEDDVVYHFKSSFQDTILTCKYSKGEAFFRSDNISTISILKDFITKEATAKKIRVSISNDVKDETFANVLRLLHPKLDYQLKLSEKVKLVEALKEIKMQEADVKFLAPEYAEILNNAAQIEQANKQQQSKLDFLFNVVTTFFVDKFKFKGQNVQGKVPQLQQVLRSYNLQRLIDFFE